MSERDYVALAAAHVDREYAFLKREYGIVPTRRHRRVMIVRIARLDREIQRRRLAGKVWRERMIEESA